MIDPDAKTADEQAEAEDERSEEPLPELPSLPPLPPLGDDEETLGAEAGGIDLDLGPAESLDMDDREAGDALLDAASLLDTAALSEGTLLDGSAEADPSLDVGVSISAQGAEYGWTADNEASHELDVAHEGLSDLSEIPEDDGEELGVDDLGHDEIDLPRLGLSIDEDDEGAAELDLGVDGNVDYGDD